MPKRRAETLALDWGTPAVPLNSHRRWPEITEDDKAAVMAVMDSQIWGIHAPKVTELAEKWADYCGTKYALPVATGTIAVVTALIGAGVRPGDRVLVPAYTYMATAQAVRLVGAIPVHVDIDPVTHNMSLAKARRLIDNKTTAIVFVYLHGLVTDTKELAALGRKHGLAIVPDAAHAAGATENGVRAGKFGTCTAFSLNGQKPFQSGEGGLVTTDDYEVFRAAERYAYLGEDRPKHLAPGETRTSWARWLGNQFRMTEMTAALALSQLTRLDGYLATARRNADILSAGLAEIPYFRPPTIPKTSESSHYRYLVELDPPSGWDRPASEYRDRVLGALSREGVAVDTWQRYPVPAHPAMRKEHPAPYYPHSQEAKLRPWKPQEFPVAAALLDSSLTVGTDPYPLHVQREGTMHAYLDAFDKVARNIDRVLTGPLEPVLTAPRIMPGEL